MTDLHRLVYIGGCEIVESAEAANRRAIELADRNVQVARIVPGSQDEQDMRTQVRQGPTT